MISTVFRPQWICHRCLARSLHPLRRRFQSSVASRGNSISPVLLGRARTIAAEYSKLSEELEEDFNPRTAKRIGELSAVTNALKQWEDASNSLVELNSLLHDPTSDPELRSLALEDIQSITEQVAALCQILVSSLTPAHPFAHLPCLLEIRPGAGGGEAALFAGDLLRMYQAFCSRKGYRTSLLKYEDAEGGSDCRGSDVSLQEAILEVDSPGAYGELRCEAGVHRVQRVPATESKGRTHTSSAAVLVLPSLADNGGDEELREEAWNDPQSDYYVDPKDVRTDIMRARGAGGQHVNTTDSAVRLTHLPTNTVVSIQDSRSQPKNREKAWRLLRSKIAQARREAREDEMVKMRRSVVGVAKMGRGDKIRTYNWGQQRVTDHRPGISVHDLDDVIDGGLGLEKVMESVKKWMGERDMEIFVEDEAREHSRGVKR